MRKSLWDVAFQWSTCLSPPSLKSHPQLEPFTSVPAKNFVSCTSIDIMCACLDLTHVFFYTHTLALSLKTSWFGTQSHSHQALLPPFLHLWAPLPRNLILCTLYLQSCIVPSLPILLDRVLFILNSSLSSPSNPKCSNL